MMDIKKLLDAKIEEIKAAPGGMRGPKVEGLREWILEHAKDAVVQEWVASLEHSTKHSLGLEPRPYTEDGIDTARLDKGLIFLRNTFPGDRSPRRATRETAKAQFLRGVAYMQHLGWIDRREVRDVLLAAPPAWLEAAGLRVGLPDGHDVDEVLPEEWGTVARVVGALRALGPGAEVVDVRWAG